MLNSKNILYVAVLLLISGTYSFALNIDGVVAYPVPFNPYKTTLKINDPTGIVNADRIEIEIYDINGDEVFSRVYSSFTTTKWSGRNDRGRRVKPGLYIIKIKAENTTEGDVKRKMIRIVVDN